MDTAVKDGGMPIDVVDTIIGKEARIALGKKRPSMLTKKGDVDPSRVAADNGYESAEAMFAEMTAAEKKSVAVERFYKVAIQEAETLIRDGLASKDVPVADAEYHSEARMAVIQADIQMLQDKIKNKDNLAKGRQTARRNQIEKKAIQEAARQMLAGKTVKDAIRYSKYSMAEAKAARLARQALMNEKYEQEIGRASCRERV